ncbi:MAG: hypothetical protein WD907_03590 [Bacilli bacterium]
MIHVTNEQCHYFINDKHSALLRQQFEDHIYSCDDCLTLYMRAIENEEAQLPVIENEALFIEETMKFIIQEKKEVPITIGKKKMWYENTIAYYSIAAGITLMLMTTGIFDQLINQISNMTTTKNQSSISESLLNKTVSVIDALDPNKEGGK